MFGDCDDFMRLLMEKVLGPEFTEWEVSLEAKRASYAAKRPPPGSCKKRGDVFVKKC